MMRGIRGCLLSILLLTSLIVLPGCNRSSNGYRTFTLKKGIAHFSFEYPKQYRSEVPVYASIEYKVTRVGFTTRSRLPWVRKADSFFRVRVDGVSDQHPNAKAAVEALISYWGESIKLLERSAVTVAGIPGEQIVYSHKPPMIMRAPLKLILFTISPDWNARYTRRNPQESELRITREVYFNYDGLIWNIQIDSDESVAEQAKADFEHLLKTFKILD